eukprot:5221903-Pleurochrysis_carterae.AAC.4
MVVSPVSCDSASEHAKPVVNAQNNSVLVGGLVGELVGGLVGGLKERFANTSVGLRGGEWKKGCERASSGDSVRVQAWAKMKRGAEMSNVIGDAAIGGKKMHCKWRMQYDLRW